MRLLLARLCLIAGLILFVIFVVDAAAPELWSGLSQFINP